MAQCGLRVVSCVCGHRIGKDELDSKFVITKLNKDSRCNIGYKCSRCGAMGTYVSKISDYWASIPTKNGKRKYKDLYATAVGLLVPTENNTMEVIVEKPITRKELAEFSHYLDTCTTPFTDIQKTLSL